MGLGFANPNPGLILQPAAWRRCSMTAARRHASQLCAWRYRGDVERCGRCGGDVGR